MPRVRNRFAEEDGDSDEVLSTRRVSQPSAWKANYDLELAKEMKRKEKGREARAQKQARKAQAAIEDDEDGDDDVDNQKDANNRTSRDVRSGKNVSSGGKASSRGQQEEDDDFQEDNDNHRGRSHSVTPLLHRSYREVSPDEAPRRGRHQYTDESPTPAGRSQQNRHRSRTNTFEGEDVEMQNMERHRTLTTQERMDAQAEELNRSRSSPSIRMSSRHTLISPEKVADNRNSNKRNRVTSPPVNDARNPGQRATKRSRLASNHERASSRRSWSPSTSRSRRQAVREPSTASYRSQPSNSRSKSSDTISLRGAEHYEDDQDDYDGEEEAEDAIEPPLLESVQAKISSSGKGRYIPRRKDYPVEVQECIDEAYLDFKARMVTGCMYPAKNEEIDAQAAGAFLRACNRLQRNYKASGKVTRIVRDSIASYRSGLVPIFRDHVRNFYGFDNSAKTAGAIDTNQELARNLLHQDQFTFKEFYPQKPRYMFRCDIIQDLINNLFFEDKDSLGVRFAYFKPMPLAVIAFVCAGIEHCIKEWLEGTINKTDFKQTANRKAMRKHENNLISIQEESESQAAYLAKLQERWYEKARLFSRVGDEDEVPLTEIIERSHFQEQYLSDDELPSPPTHRRNPKASLRSQADLVPVASGNKAGSGAVNEEDLEEERND